MFVLVLIMAAAAFVLSASAGLGGSLILVPGLCLVLGAKQGIATAALLLAFNNVSKVIVYRDVIPWRKAVWVLVFTGLGALVGAALLVVAPEFWVSIAVIAIIGSAFVMESARLKCLSRVSAPTLALCAGATSGFSGTSGPLKGIAIRNLNLDRAHFVGAASVVSLVGDLVKAAVYTHASLLPPDILPVLACAVPISLLAAVVGRRINNAVGERAYATLFWTVMAGYSLRLVLT